mmetsp:Transcript_25046/g.54606  ORF Transcript_25046/g.54606 Transcript_25046/m.54606 type:complete len:344 (+) Transcript_25046:47-1078(+)
MLSMRLVLQSMFLFPPMRNSSCLKKTVASPLFSFLLKRYVNTTNAAAANVILEKNLFSSHYKITSSNTDMASFVTLDDGTKLPFDSQPSPLNIILGHGLGTNPKEKSHENDISTDVWNDTLQYLQSNYKVSAASGGLVVRYTARGHGDSRGWEKSATTCSADEPFRWPALSEDMLVVADSCGLADTKFAIFGQSMGAATGLYLTIDNPDRVSALILARSPRAWESRAKVASTFLTDAGLLDARMPGSQRHLPILGAARTDLPPRTETETYDRIQCPTLILSHGRDDAHPISTGKYLAELIPHARFDIADNEDDARNQWPKIIGDWLVEKGLVSVKDGRYRASI